MTCKKLMALLLSVCMVLGLMSGCGSTDTETTQSGEASVEAVSVAEDTEAEAEEAEPETEETAAEAETPEEAIETEAVETDAPASAEDAAEPEEERAVIEYPLEGGVTLSIWRAFESMMWGDLMSGYEDMPMIPYIQEATGVTLEFEAVNDASSTEAFNLMIAGGDYADMIDMSKYTGGISKAYEDGLIYDLTDYIDEYMPDYAAALEELAERSPKNYKSTLTNDGRTLAVYSIDDEYQQEQGLVFRADWANEIGMEDITTLEDLDKYLDYTVSTYGVRYGMTPSNGGLIDGITGAFGITGFDASGSSVDVGLYLDGDTVVSSMTSEGYREYMEWFAEKYAQGAVYTDFYSESYGPDWINSYFAEDNVAISFLRSDKISSIASEAADPDYALTPTTSIVKEEGDTFIFGDEQSVIKCNSCIMATSDKLEEAMEFLNWFYTDDGYILSNFGVEGYTFDYNEDGEPRFSDIIMESDYSNKVQVRNMYGAMIFPYLKDTDAFYYTYADVEQEAIQIWNNISDAGRVPSFDLDGDASTEFATLASDIVAYAATVCLKWMTGEVALTDEAWNEYVETCNSMGLEDAVAIYQDGYDAFMAR